MTTTPSPLSTCVDIEAPDVATPIWPIASQPRVTPGPPSPHVFHVPYTQTPSNTIYPGAQVQFAAALAGSTPVQTLTWDQGPGPMQLCTSPELSSLSSVAQQDLPGVLPTPGREMQHFTSRVQGNWDTLLDFIKKQEKAVSELTQGLKATSSQHCDQITNLATKMKDNQQQVLTLVASNKKQDEDETDQLTKAIKLMITGELKKVESTFVSEVRFIVDQLQLELQQDLKTMQQNFQKSHDRLTAEMHQCSVQTASLCTDFKKFQTEMVERSKMQEKKLVDLLKESIPTPPGTTSISSPPSTVTAPEIPPTTTVVRSDHLKITFPTFGRPLDDPDPLLYLTRCQDFLALHPLVDADLLATFRTVLYGTARDWWEVARSSVTTWGEFESAFLSAFLSEDYEDELADRIRIRTQGEKESIRDFAFSYRALCKRWKPSLTESEMVKMILKNIKPYLASQLRSRVSTVEELVKLGHQLEKDYVQQVQYEGRKDFKPPPTMPQRPVSSQPVEKPQVQCWRCKGSHSPGNCPHFMSASNQPSVQQRPTNNKRFFQPMKSGGPPRQPATPSSNAVSATLEESTSTSSNTSNQLMAVPQQLVVPISIGPWRGKAIVDTGASYTLIHESLWTELNPPGNLQAWTLGPLYLANGEAEVPLGWINLPIMLHNKTFPVQVAVLSYTALAYAVILGLDFIFFSGLQIDVTDRNYSFKSAPNEHYPFQPGQASVPVVKPPHLKKRQHLKSVNQSLSLLSSIPPLQHPLLSQPLDSLDEQALMNLAVNGAHLPPDGKQQLRQILESNSQVCTLQPGRTDVLQHHLYITHPVPLKQRPYRMSPSKQAVVREQLEEMLKAGIVEPSHSAWASPVVLVPKKDGKMRFCVDYRKVNAITESDAYPLPNITEILESLSGASIFSTIDLNSGYWQVTMGPDSKPMTAFITPSGLYQFTVMPFGLKNAPATFQRLMETVLGELRGNICFVYIDDIIIYSPSMNQHFLDLQTVLHRLQTAGLTINLKKSKFCLQELTFLGHVVNIHGITTDLSKVEAIRAYPVPRNIKEVQRFLGLAGWYHRFVPNFSRIAEPINSLKKKGRAFHWSPQCQRAFEQLKAYLTSPPILGHPNLELPFIVYTDASDIGLGAVLTQRKDQGSEQVIAYASRSLSKAETNYSTTEKECLAVIWALERWQHYLEPKLFTVVTDHSALQWVMSSTKTTSRLIRWVLRLQKFDFVIEYRKGRLNVAPDALSRIHPQPGCSLYVRQTEKSDLPITAAAIWEEQHKDPVIIKLFQTLAGDDQLKNQYEVIEDKLYHTTQLKSGQRHYRVYLPNSLISAVLHHYHSNPLSGHMGIYKTYQRLHDIAFWPGMWTDVKNHVKRCVKCQTLKGENRKPAGKIQQVSTSHPNEMLGVDIMGPMPRSTHQNEYLLVFVDYFTRWVELFPMRNARAETVAALFRREILTRWGVPDFILSDRGSQFLSAVFKEICGKWGVTQKLTTAYHPQTNMTERVNRNLKYMMAAYVEDNHKKWDQYLPELRFAVNSAVQESIGMTPAELHLGRKLQGPMDKLLRGKNISPDLPSYDVVSHLVQLQAKAKECCQKAQKRQLRSYNKNRRDASFKEKDRVWLRNFPQSSGQHHFSAKLAQRWKGPYRIIKQQGPINYQVALESSGEDVRNVHVSNLKACFPTAEELEIQEGKRLLEIFQESSEEDEEFLGF